MGITNLLVLVLWLLVPAGDEREELFDAAFETITETDLLADLEILAGPEAQGRDSPSAGLSFAAEHITERLKAAGFVGLGKDGSFLLPFKRGLPTPDPRECALSAELADGESVGSFEFGIDYTPVYRAEGEARGELVLLGFGIDSHEHRFDEITGDLDGTIALIVSGEPEHKRRFDGEDVTIASELFAKLESLREAGVAGALVVRRPPLADPADMERQVPRALGFRHTWAAWVGNKPATHAPDHSLPTLEISPAAAQRLTGLDVIERLSMVEKRVKPLKPERTGIVVSLASKTETRDVEIHNVVGEFVGADPKLTDEYVVLGAHYDHLGVDSRGRIGYGADDNASGTSAMLEIAEALSLTKPRRSILVCAFAAEEDGLVGSKEFVRDSPINPSDMVAMLNMDMLGYGETAEVAVIGVPENPELGKLLKKAKRLRSPKISKVVTGQGQSLFKRSDHYSFHTAGVPVLFFFEGLPSGSNPHYHTWQDTIDTLDIDKIARSARLVFNTAWLLSEDDERPPPPEHTR